MEYQTILVDCESKRARCEIDGWENERYDEQKIIADYSNSKIKKWRRKDPPGTGRVDRYAKHRACA